MKYLASCYLALFLTAACSGDAFTSATARPVDAGAGDVLEHDQGDGDAGDELELASDVAAPDAGDANALSDTGAGADARILAPDDAGDASGDALAEGSPDGAGDVIDAGELACDPAYGDASPGGPCCVHVWATPTMGGVLCTVDGSRWCWQTGMPCSPVGSRCVTQFGVSYCAP